VEESERGECKRGKSKAFVFVLTAHLLLEPAIEEERVIEERGRARKRVSKDSKRR
jgi:hypothetical protein